MAGSVATTAGGCISIKASAVTLSSLDVSGCAARSGGGLFVASGSALQLTDTLIQSSVASSGAGIFVDASTVDGQNVQVQHCSANFSGGGVVLAGATSRLSGATIQECSAHQGGGVYVLNTARAALSHVEIKSNSAAMDGGGIFAAGTDIVIASVRVANNTASNGGGLCAVNASVSGALRLEFNEAKYGGGALSSGLVTLEAVVFDANSARSSGGGIFAGDGELTLRNVDVKACVSTNGMGGGVSLENTRLTHDRVLISHCAALLGGGLYLNGSSFSPPAADVLSSPAAAMLRLNEASGLGGNVYIIGALSSVDQLSIVGGSAVSGGGIAVENAATCAISNSEVRNATVSSLGGGIYVGANADCLLLNAVVEFNNADHAGGGVAVYQGIVHHSNVVVQRNKAKNGGGLYVSSSSSSGTSPVESSVANVVQWTDPSFQRSLLDANLVVSDANSGANALVECVATCELSGFRIARGEVPSGRGGGVYISGKGTTTISHVLLEQNRAQLGGGVFISQAANTSFSAVSVTDNVAQRGAGLAVESKSAALAAVSVSASVFYNNTASQYGGAVYLSGPTFSATSMLVLENRATQSDAGQGGGIFSLAKASVTINKSLFLLNEALFGGSIAAIDESETAVDASVITGDSARFTSGWSALFKRIVGVDYAGKKTATAGLRMKAQRGDLVFVSGEKTVIDITNSYLTYGSAESGGGASVENGAAMTVSTSELSFNRANESGGSVYVATAGASASFDLTEISSSSTWFTML